MEEVSCNSFLDFSRITIEIDFEKNDLAKQNIIINAKFIVLMLLTLSSKIST